MNTIPTKPETHDELEKLFSDFFKAQLKHPWPNAPLPAAGASASTPQRSQSEPSELVASRATETPRNAPTPSRRDSNARARFTLAASVALAIGACWALSNGFQPGDRSTGTDIVAPGMLPDSGASGEGHLPLNTIKENKAKENNGGNGGVDAGPKIEKFDLDKSE